MDESEDSCPLCCEEYDPTDKNFRPCSCGYQICLWCWHQIKLGNGLCPACRTPYTDKPITDTAVDRNEVIRKHKERKQKAKSQKKTTITPQHRKSLSNMRVVQRNLVYAIGLSPQVCDEEKLRRREYFGQYGKIVKVVVNRNAAMSADRVASGSAYITYARKEDAKMTIQCLDGHWLDNRMIRASFGTTKYCNNFLRNMNCNNPECLYLHEMGGEGDSFTKEEMQAAPLAPPPVQASSTAFNFAKKNAKHSTRFPPPVEVQTNVGSSSSNSSPGVEAGCKSAVAAAPVRKTESISAVMEEHGKKQLRVDAPQSASSSPAPGSSTTNESIWKGFQRKGTNDNALTWAPGAEAQNGNGNGNGNALTSQPGIPSSVASVWGNENENLNSFQPQSEGGTTNNSIFGVDNNGAANFFGNMLGLTSWGADESSKFSYTTGFQHASDNSFTDTKQRSSEHDFGSAPMQVEFAPQTRNVNHQVASKMFGVGDMEHGAVHGKGGELRFQQSQNPPEEHHKFGLMDKSQHPASWPKPSAAPTPASTIWGSGNLFQQSGNIFER